MKTFIKRTIIGGLLFLIPISLIVLILLKVFSFMLMIAKWIDQIIPINTVYGIATANILAVILVVIICFLFGLLATNKGVDKLKNTLESKVLMKIPGYLFIKAMTKHLETNKDKSSELDPVLVILDDNAQLGFLIEDPEKGLSTVFLPGSPNPWSGNVIYVEKARIKPLGITADEAIKHLEQVGRNSDFINQ